GAAGSPPTGHVRGPPRSAPPARRAGRDGTGEVARSGSRCPACHDCASITSTMLDVKLDSSDRLDLYEQVAAEIRRAIAEGKAKPGERLPLAKDLAAVLGVNT